MRRILGVGIVAGFVAAAMTGGCDTEGGGDPTKVGSCAYVGSCNGPTCVDYGGSIDAAESKTQCEMGGSTWSTTRCAPPSSGGCLADTAGVCNIQWYTDSMTADDVKAACTMGGTTYVTE